MTLLLKKVCVWVNQQVWLVQSLQKIPRIVLGITRNNKEGTVVSSRASVLDDQKEVYKKIIENGTKVDVQFTTTDKAEPLESKVSL